MTGTFLPDPAADRMAGWLDGSEASGRWAHCCGWSNSLTLAQAAPVEAEFRGGREGRRDILTKLSKDDRTSVVPRTRLTPPVRGLQLTLPFS